MNEKVADSTESLPSSSVMRRNLKGFATRSIRKSQWRLFKHNPFFSSSNSSTKTQRNHLQPPILTLRHPSIDGAGMFTPVTLSPPVSPSLLQPSPSLCGSEVMSECGTMTAPTTPNVPLSASSVSGVSDGWKYSSQRLLWKLKPRHISFSHASSTSSSTDSAWKSTDSTTWRSVEGAEVTLRGTRLEVLSDSERLALQTVVLSRLTTILPGISLGKQRDTFTMALKKKRAKLMKSSRTLTVSEQIRRSSGTSIDEDKKLFGVSIHATIEAENNNAAQLKKETSPTLGLTVHTSRCRSFDDSAVSLSVPAEKRKNFKHSKHSVSGPIQTEQECAADAEKDEKTSRWLCPTYQSPSASPSAPPSTNSSASYAVVCKGGDKFFSSSIDFSQEETNHHTLQVPKIVADCTEFLSNHGLNTVGLFRVAGSARRCRQLRLSLDRIGSEVSMESCSASPHDVATILKEYFRDLPQSLLPREHYQAYIAAAKLPWEERLECLRLLVSLLTPPVLDTLFVLLNFLKKIASNATEKIDAEGLVVSNGNKMDAHNLATIFAPCILRPDHDKLHATLSQSEQQICVVEMMIERADDLFIIPRDLQSLMLNKMRETEPDRLDRLLYGLNRQESEVGQARTCSIGDELSHEEKPPTPQIPANQHCDSGVSWSWRGSWPFQLSRSGRSGSNSDSCASPGPSCLSDPPSASNVSHSEECVASLSTSAGLPAPRTPTPTTPTRCEKTVESSGSSFSHDVFTPIRHSSQAVVSGARRRLRSVARAIRLSFSSRSTPDVTASDTLL